LATLIGLGAGWRLIGPRWQRSAPCRALCAALSRQPIDRARRTRDTCRSPDPVECHTVLVPLALDLGLYDAVPDALDSMAGPCADCDGMRAEALAGVGRIEEARHLARRAAKARVDDRHAAMALALAERRRDRRAAMEQAKRALLFGRGAPAQVLLAELHLELGQLELAEQELRPVIEADAQNATAQLGQARIADIRERYRDAREGYFRALELRPDYVEARYRLAKLVHRAGARDEARHHLEKLRAVAPPGDPRLIELEQTLARP
jgi:tetratricopeptide (TPR) repeat protein